MENHRQKAIAGASMKTSRATCLVGFVAGLGLRLAP